MKKADSFTDRSRTGRPTAIGALSSRAAGPAIGKRGFGSAALIANWPSVVGIELSTFACPLEVRFPRGKNDHATLMLRVAHGSAATLIHLKAPAVLERVNRFFGYNAVERVQISQGPLPASAKTASEGAAPLSAERQAEVEKDVAAVGPPELKAALRRLGEALQRRST